MVNKHLPKFLGIFIVAGFLLFFCRMWLFPTPPDALFTKDKPATLSQEKTEVVEDEALALSREGAQDIGDLEGENQIVLSSLQNIEDQQKRETPALLGGESRRIESTGEVLPQPPALRLESLNHNSVRSNSSSQTAAPVQKSVQNVENQLWLQAGAFSSRDNALNLQGELRRQGFPTEVERVEVNGQSFHRVYVGPIQEAQLETFKKRLQALGVQARQVQK